jgi:hypothetical protein
MNTPRPAALNQQRNALTWINAPSLACRANRARCRAALGLGCQRTSPLESAGRIAAKTLSRRADSNCRPAVYEVASITLKSANSRTSGHVMSRRVAPFSAHTACSDCCTQPLPGIPSRRLGMPVATVNGCGVARILVDAGLDEPRSPPHRPHRRWLRLPSDTSQVERQTTSTAGTAASVTGSATAAVSSAK